MTKTWRAVVLAGVGAALAPLAQAALIGTGIANTYPHINGIVKAGEADEVARTFVAPLKKPLTLRMHPSSDAREVAKIGRWMQEHRPALLIKDSCVASCARALLPSGSTISIAPGTVTASTSALQAAVISAFGGCPMLGACNSWAWMCPATSRPAAPRRRSC